VLPLTLGLGRRKSLVILCLGAHPDDIEIGCGGTVLRLLEEPRRVRVYWIVFSGDKVRGREARRSARRVLRRVVNPTIRIEGFRDGFFPQQSTAIKEVFEHLKQLEVPDLVFTHRQEDAHQDHRVIGELTWNTFRDHFILEYEIPKFDGDLGQPNIFVPLSAPVRRRKLRWLLTAFPSQSSRRWYSSETFDGLMRLRGVECGAKEGYAEAFHARKVLLGSRPKPL
jgi:LmbE family N-acetylglucosaminyl deacetylase